MCIHEVLKLLQNFPGHVVGLSRTGWPTYSDLIYLQKVTLPDIAPQLALYLSILYNDIMTRL